MYRVDQAKLPHLLKAKSDIRMLCYASLVSVVIVKALCAVTFPEMRMISTLKFVCLFVCYQFLLYVHCMAVLSLAFLSDCIWFLCLPALWHRSGDVDKTKAAWSEANIGTCSTLWN